MLVDQIELRRQCERVEQYVTRGVPSTLRTFDEFAACLGFYLDYKTNPEYLLAKYLEDKDVLDIGSGLNGLAVAVELMGLNTRVTSVSPGLVQPDFEQFQKDKLAESYTYTSADYTEERVEAARLVANSRSYPFFAHNLGFADNSFDVIIDNFAVFDNSRPEVKLVLIKSIEEMLRVTRPGGKIRVGGGLNFGPDWGWKEEILRNMGLDFAYHQCGVEIVVPSPITG